jgi:hypothetical protein
MLVNGVGTKRETPATQNKPTKNLFPLKETYDEGKVCAREKLTYLSRVALTRLFQQMSQKYQ